MSMRDNEEKMNIIKKRGKRALNFFFSLEMLRSGKKVQRLKWKKNTYIFLNDKKMIMSNNPTYVNQVKFEGSYPYVASYDDILGDDWIIIDDTPLIKKRRKKNR